MRIYTRRGDRGSTGLLFGGDRISKSHPRTDASGTIDEAVSALGMARATLEAGPLSDLVVRLQRELFVVGAEVATHADRRHRLTPGVSLVSETMVPALEREIDALEEQHPMPAEFVLPGETLSGAGLDLARSIVRRAERSCVALDAAGELAGSFVVPYLNRLADLLFVMARAADGSFRPVREGARLVDDSTDEANNEVTTMQNDPPEPAADQPDPDVDVPEPVSEQRPPPPPEPAAEVEDAGSGDPGAEAAPSEREPEEGPRAGVAGMGESVATLARQKIAEPSSPEATTLDEAEVDRIFRRSVALFNQSRYWHAHEGWEILWRAANDRDRDFYQGLILVAAGLLHLQRRNRRGARNKLSEGIAKLRPYHPTHRGIVVDELVGRASVLLDELESGGMPYLVPPVVKFVP